MGTSVVPIQYERPKSVHDCAARLIQLGYFPVPIPMGRKGPTIDGWQNLRCKPEDVPNLWDTTGMSIGVLHVNTAALDIDVYDPDLAARLLAEGMRRFPGALERIGHAPKTAIVMRVEGPEWAVRATSKGKKGDLTAQVDIRAFTRQFVAYGYHPDTGKPYTWPRGELWNTPNAALPVITKDEAQSFRDWCEAEILAWAGEDPRKVIDLEQRRQSDIGDEKCGEALFLEALQWVSPSLGHEDGWCEALMAIHDFYNGSNQGLEVAKDWSSSDPRYTPREVESKWKSFKVGGGVTYRAVLGMAKKAGADLREMRRRLEPSATYSEERTFSGAKQYADPTQALAAEPAETAKTGAAIEWFRDIAPALTDSYIVKSFIGADTMSVIYGPSNSGKTFFTLDLAFHIAAGLPWRGRRVNRAGVLYLAAEGGKGVANRIAALKIEKGTGDIPLALRRAGLDLLKQEADLQIVFNLANEVKAASGGGRILIVIDTLSRVMAGGDENSAADMTALIRNIDAIREATNSHIMLVHHSGKDVARGARGHSSLRAATDTEIEVQNEDGSRAAIVTKQRDYQGGETFAFDLKPVLLGVDQDGDEVSSCVIEATDSEEFKAARKAAKGRGKNQQIIMDTFDQMVSEGMATGNPGGVGMPESGQFWAVNTNELRRIAQGKMTGDNTAKLFRQAWDALTASDGLFVTGDNLAWRIDRRKK